MSARFFFSVGVAAAVFCAYSAMGTLRFISESTLAEGTVVDWTRGRTRAGRSSEPGAYFRIIEIEAPNGQRIRGEAEVGVDIAGWRSASVSRSAIEPTTRRACGSSRFRTSGSSSWSPA